MDIDLEIRGKTFRVSEIASFNTQWDDESKIQHVTITLRNGDVTDFIEENVPHPFAGELYGYQELYEKFLAFSD